MQIMESGQDGGHPFTSLEEMMNVGTRMGPASIAGAARLNWSLVMPEPGIPYIDMPSGYEKAASSGVPGRNDAVEHINAGSGKIDKVLWLTDPHQIAGTALREIIRTGSDSFHHLASRLSDGDASNGISIKFHRG